MPVQILGGFAKGQSLLVPKGELVRPTSVRLKRRLFDSQQNWEGGVVFDLCAGTGSLGLESWSRGASEVYLVESSLRVVSLLKKNVQYLSVSFSDEVSRSPIFVRFYRLPHYIEKLRQIYLSWSLDKQVKTTLFFDPPYELHRLYDEVGQLIFNENWFRGRLYIESDEQKGIKLKDLSSHFCSPSKTFIQGTSYLALFLFE